MAFLTAFLGFAAPIILLLLVGIGGYAYSQIRHLSLPIPGALALLTILLPIFAGTSAAAVSRMFTRDAPSSASRKPSTIAPSLIAIALLTLSLIYETAIATLALTHAVPSSTRTCSLDARWLELFRAKDAHAIQSIQNAFQCCGLHSTRDRAWPFPSGLPGEDGAGACVRTYKYTRSCGAMWEAADGTNAGLLVLVAGVVFLTKVVGLFWMFRNPLARPPWMRAQDSAVPRRLPGSAETESRRLNGVPAIEASYRDEEEDAGEQANRNGGASTGPRIEPSGLAASGHEWRNENEA